MKTIALYKFRKRAISILLVVCCGLVVTYLVTEDWGDPNWLLLASLSANVFMVGSIGLTYRNTGLQLMEDQIRFRPLGKKETASLRVSPQSEFSKDWKGIYVKDGHEIQKIPLEYMTSKEGEALFNEIRAYYRQTPQPGPSSGPDPALS